MRYPILLFFAACLFTVSCTKEHDITTIVEEPFAPITNIEIKSLVISIGEDMPFTCVIGETEYVSQGSGLLLISNILLDRNGSQIIVKADGYYDEVRYVIPSLGARMHHEVTLTRIDPVPGVGTIMEVFDASLGGTVKLYRTEFTFEPNSIVDASGNVYSGEVKIFANKTYLNAYYTLIRRFPQNLLKENEISKTLNFIGGHYIEMRDDAMKPLYLKEGLTIPFSLEVKITPGFTVPDIMDLIQYNNDKTEWENIGTVVKDGERWHGSLSTLGKIGWGVTHDSRPIQIKLVTPEGIPVPNKFVYLLNDFDTPFSLSFSDHEGNVRMHAPVDDDFQLATIERMGADVIEWKNIEAMDYEDGSLVELEDFVLSPDFYQTYSGKIIGCHGETIINSALIGQCPEELGASQFMGYFFSNEDGEFNFAMPNTKQKTLEFSAYNLNDDIVSSKYLISNNEEPNIEIGNLTICNDYEYYINYNLDGQKYTYSYDTEISTAFTGSIYKSLFSSGSIPDADEKNKTSFRLEHDVVFQLNNEYQIYDLSIQYDDGQNTLAIECIDDCPYAVRMNRITVDYYEGIIVNTQDSNSEVIVGAFRIPRP